MSKMSKCEEEKKKSYNRSPGVDRQECERNPGWLEKSFMFNCMKF